MHGLKEPKYSLKTKNQKFEIEFDSLKGLKNPKSLMLKNHCSDLGISHILRSRPIGGEGFIKILW